MWGMRCSDPTDLAFSNFGIVAVMFQLHLRRAHSQFRLQSLALSKLCQVTHLQSGITYAEIASENWKNLHVFMNYRELGSRIS